MSVETEKHLVQPFFGGPSNEETETRRGTSLIASVELPPLRSSKAPGAAEAVQLRQNAVQQMTAYTRAPGPGVSNY